MSDVNIINDIKINKSSTNLSKNAINFLSKQLVRDGDKIILKEKFIFQIVYCMKKLPNWYCCSLIDQNSKFGGFCIRFADKSKIPKEGDIIETENIEIVKLPSRDSYLYFCDNVKLIEERKDVMKINIYKVNSKKIIEEEKKDKEDNNMNNNEKYITPNKKKNINNNSEKKDSNKSKKEYTLLKDILEEKGVKNPLFYLKCMYKSAIKNFKTEKGEGTLQYYYFLDTEGEKIKVFAYYYLNYNYFNNLINPGNVYEISNLDIQKNVPEFAETFPLRFALLRYNTKIRKLEDNGDFTKIRFINDKINTKIKDLKGEINPNPTSKFHLHVVGIVLEDRGIIETKTEHKYRMLIIGDSSFCKIQTKLWVKRIPFDRVFHIGDIIYLRNIIYHERSIFNELSSDMITEVYNCLPSPIEQQLKEFYKKHPYSYEYNDMNLAFIRKRKEFEFKFISDLKKEYRKELGESNENKYIKLRAYISNIIHRENNIYLRCDFCNKKVDKAHCLQCGRDSKLYFYIGLEIKDCSGYLYIELFKDKAESLFKMNPEEYIKIVKENNEEKIKEINSKILYKNYIFYCKSVPIKGYFGGFSVIHFENEKKEYYRDLIQNLAFQLK